MTGRPTYRAYMMFVLMLILAFNNKDRHLFGLLLQEIKVDLRLTDTELGLLTGIAFSLFYALMGVPIARWADRGNRVRIISVCTALWSAAVAACGTAMGFFQLLAFRIAVGVGEAGCVPPAHSLIASYYSRDERPKAMSYFMLGGPLSLVVGYLLAGQLNEIYGWRFTFMLLGVPGVALAVLAWFTLREPRTLGGGCDAKGVSPTGPSEASPGLGEVALYLRRNAAFRNLLIAFAVSSFFSAGIGQWQAAFFIRSFGISTSDLGVYLTVTFGLSSLVGVMLGGYLASRYAARNEKLQLRLMATVIVGFGALSAGVYLSRDPITAFALLALATLGTTLLNAPLFAMIQTLVPESMRALSVAAIYFVANLIGGGLGPLAAGVMSDALHATLHQESLRFALLALCPGYLWSAWHLIRAAKTVERDIAAAELGASDSHSDAADSVADRFRAEEAQG
ncbi:MFS transporter [Sphingobium sp. Sx8-8]|uniref:spinster family MFS transporter n=1 Tax=Sphingobium sp. Sx8-8 TaxID=2933617 RepID=UPI001F57F3F1